MTITFSEGDPPRPTQPCGPRRIIHARWRTTPVKCGDNAEMLATTENIPAETSATFTVKKISDGSTIATENSRTQASSVQAFWISQKPSDSWNGAEINFTVVAGGERADSEDPQLEFHHYSDIAEESYDQNYSAPVPNSSPPVNYGWERRVDVELDDRVLIIHVPIKVTKRQGNRPKRRKNESYADYHTRCAAEPLEGTGNLSAEEKASLKNAIERIYRQKMALHRTGCARHSQPDGCSCRTARKCCKIEIRVDVQFYDRTGTEDATNVNYWSGSGRADSGNWFSSDNPRDTKVFAHEVGHLLGFYDEYTPDGAWGPSPWTHNNPGSLMKNGTRLETYYFQVYADWLRSETGEQWAVVRY